MSTHSKVLVVFENPAALKELLTAASSAAGIELLPLRDRRQASTFVSVNPNLAAVIVEHAGESKAALEVLQNLQAAHPKLRRVVVADSTDVLRIIDGLHSGAIDAVIYRPPDAKQLHAAVFGQPLVQSALPAKPAQALRRAVSPSR